MSDIYQARKEYTEWDMLEDERIRLGNHVPDGYLLSVPDEDVERLFCNLGAEGDKLLDNSRQKWNEIKALLYELLTSKSQYVSGVKICTLEDKISDLAMLNRQIGSVHEQQSRMPERSGNA